MGALQYIDIGRISPHPDNPRKDVGDVSELAASIKENGVLQNLTVVPYFSKVHNRTMEGMYTVIIGHRRLAACKLAGIEKVPCIVADMSPEEQFSTMMIENMQRCDLTPIEEADGFQLMLDMGGTVAEISEKTGISETKIRNRVKMGKLPRKEVVEAYERGATIRDYMQLEKLKDPKAQKKALQAIGTDSFIRIVSQELRAQEDREWTDMIVGKLLEGGWIERISGGDKVDHAKYEHYVSLHTWQKDHVEDQIKKPIDAGRRKYIFYADIYGISLYRERLDTDKNSPAGMEEYERLRVKYADQLDDIMDEMEMVNQEFRDMREDFVENFTRFDRYREEIMTMAADVMLAKIKARQVPSYEYTDMDHEELGAALGLKCDKKSHKIGQADYHMRAQKDPLRVLLETSYYAMEDGHCEVWHQMYEADLKTYRPIFHENKNLVRLYSMLRELGYNMSKEEEAYLTGSMLQFTEAAAVAKKFREEWEAKRTEREK